MAARLVDQLAERFLAMAIIADQPAIGLGLLDRVEILALDILDERDLERLGVAEVADDRRNFVQPRPLRRPPAPFAGDDLEAMAVRPDDDRLDDAARRRSTGRARRAPLRRRPGEAGRDAARCSPPESAAPRRCVPPPTGASRWTSPSSEERPRPRPEGGGGGFRRSCRLRLLGQPRDQLARQAI